MFPCVPQIRQEVAQTRLVFAGNCWNLNANAFMFMYLSEPVSLSCFCLVISASGFVLIESLSHPRLPVRCFPPCASHTCVLSCVYKLCSPPSSSCAIIIWFLQQLLVFVCSSCPTGLCIFLTRMFSLPFWMRLPVLTSLCARSAPSFLTKWSFHWLFIGSAFWVRPESVLDNIHNNERIGLSSPMVIQWWHYQQLRTQHGEQKEEDQHVKITALKRGAGLQSRNREGRGAEFAPIGVSWRSYTPKL